MDLQKLNDHVRTYAFKSDGSEWTISERVENIREIEAELIAIDAPTKAQLSAAKKENDAAIKQNLAVEEMLINLKASNPSQFEIVRKQSFINQSALL